MTAEAFRVLLEAMTVIIEAVRKIIKAVRLFVEAVRLLVEAGRVLRSSANKSIPIDPRLRNNFLHSRFDPVKKIILSTLQRPVPDIVFSSFLPCLGQILFRFDLARIETRMVCFRFDPAENGTSFSSLLFILRLIMFALLRSCQVLE